jgi:hypothetical protein
MPAGSIRVGMRLNYPLDATERCQPHSASEFALQEASHNKTIVNIMLLVNFQHTGDTHTPSLQYVASEHLQPAHYDCTSSSSTLAAYTPPKMTTTTKRIMISKPGLKRAIITLPRSIVILLTTGSTASRRAPSHTETNTYSTSHYTNQPCVYHWRCPSRWCWAPSHDRSNEPCVYHWRCPSRWCCAHSHDRSNKPRV